MAFKIAVMGSIRQIFTPKVVIFTCICFGFFIPKTSNSSDLELITTGQQIAPFDNCFKESARTHEIAPNLLIAVGIVESSLDPTAISKANALGLMQIKWPQTAEHLGITNRALLFDPCTNIEAGARYLAEVRKPYLLLTQQDRSNMMLAAYRIGPNAIKGFDKMPPIVEDYIQKVRLEKDRLDAREALPIPSPYCEIQEFKTIALTTHHPQTRSEKSRDWIERNHESCDQTTWEILIDNLPNWLGTAHHKIKLSEIIDQAKRRKH